LRIKCICWVWNNRIFLLLRTIRKGKPSFADECCSGNKNLLAPPAIVSVTYSLILGKLLWIVLSFWFTKHHKIVLKNNNENKAFHKISHGDSSKNNTNTCKGLFKSGLKNSITIAICLWLQWWSSLQSILLLKKVLITLFLFLFTLNTVLHYAVRTVQVVTAHCSLS
jgi:hypothetical protein